MVCKHSRNHAVDKERERGERGERERRERREEREREGITCRKERSTQDRAIYGVYGFPPNDVQS